MHGSTAMVYAPLNTASWPDWYPRKFGSSHETSNPAHDLRLVVICTARRVLVSPYQAGPGRQAAGPCHTCHTSVKYYSAMLQASTIIVRRPI